MQSTVPLSIWIGVISLGVEICRSLLRFEATSATVNVLWSAVHNTELLSRYCNRMFVQLLICADNFISCSFSNDVVPQLCRPLHCLHLQMFAGRTWFMS